MLGQDAWDTLPAYMREADEREGYPLLTWLGGLCDLVQPTVDLLDMETTPADPAVTPSGMLSFFAALGGCDVSAIPGADLRGWIASQVGSARGSDAAVRARVGLTLTGTKWVQIECPYGGDPFAVRITTRTAQTPDTAATDAAAALEVPAWLTLTTATAAGLTYTELAARYSTYDALTASGLTYDQLASLT
jgi:hypothetical protein